MRACCAVLGVHVAYIAALCAVAAGVALALLTAAAGLAWTA